ncbi:mitochondrial f1f0 ATP synthase subunit [Grosmannia clavigera kw1407]|uniref:Mitochondrial f1f0 ATP synthase subunit n=1 Tax=Grosmannia clavigera (strain kw1407 / UAMH 11150) TaxID=655863 RepID=F0XFU0_GROCL|nr:mitochondrial f1f0 ATP synthase subunit [Grosmannia clavigera kw1407]EFX04814.1 mitochondrial f1f0 ATP synthase subunit [Grosmannia clavigera kw1407]
MLQSLSRSATARRALATAARSSQTTMTRTTVQMRTFIVPTVARRADFVQELYLKELKAYKVPAVKPEDAKGQVATFALPKTPASPEEADLASSLQEYETMAVEVEGQEGPADGSAVAAPRALTNDRTREPRSMRKHLSP